MKQVTTLFTQQLNSFSGSLHAFALTFTRDDEDARDLVQDTMVKAIRYSGLYEEGTNMKGWLFTILRNTFINNYRKNSRSGEIFTVCEEISSAQLKKSASVNEGENKCVMDDIQYALKKLQPEYYIPFIRYFEGFKYHEIAEELNIPLGTVKTRIHVARGILKKSLKMYQDNYRKAG